VSSPTRLIAAVVKRLERLESIRQLMARDWECTGDTKHVVRRDDVTGLVARELDVPLSPRLRISVALLGKQLGWLPLHSGNKRLFARVKLRRVTRDDAVESSKELRRK
jgi:hypothetical protein